MFPGHVDCGFHIVCEDDKLRGSAVIMGAKADDVHLSHSGRENSEKTKGEQGSRSAPVCLQVSICTVEGSMTKSNLDGRIIWFLGGTSSAQTSKTAIFFLRAVPE
jgi:hypothetical protein